MFVCLVTDLRLLDGVEYVRPQSAECCAACPDSDSAVMRLMRFPKVVVARWPFCQGLYTSHRGKVKAFLRNFSIFCTPFQKLRPLIFKRHYRHQLCRGLAVTLKWCGVLFLQYSALLKFERCRPENASAQCFVSDIEWLYMSSILSSSRIFTKILVGADICR